MLPSAKMQKMNGVSRSARYEQRKVVCRRCGLIMSDIEDMTSNGEFWHGPMYMPKADRKRKPCPNDGKAFDITDTKEVAEFVRKRVRRAAKRAGTSV